MARGPHLGGQQQQQQYTWEARGTPVASRPTAGFRDGFRHRRVQSAVRQGQDTWRERRNETLRRCVVVSVVLQVQILIFIRDNERKGSVKVRLEKVFN